MKLTQPLTQTQEFELRQDLIDFECMEALVLEAPEDHDDLLEDIEELVGLMPIEKVIINLDLLYGEDWSI